MSDDEDEKVEDEAPDALPKPTKRRRPSNQTAEKRAAWDRETKDLRNAKARERRFQKKTGNSESGCGSRASSRASSGDDDSRDGCGTVYTSEGDERR